jgi:hypothetical protein
VGFARTPHRLRIEQGIYDGPRIAPSRRLPRLMLITQFANALTQLPNFFELHIVGFRIPRVDRVDFGFQLRKFRDEAR